MKKTYMSPTLVQYGRLSQLTLGRNACDTDNSQGQNNTANQNNGQLNNGVCGPITGGTGS